MMVAVAKQMVERKLTVDDLEAMPDVERWELIGGELREIMTSAFDHSRRAKRIDDPLSQYVYANNLGEVLSTQASFVVRDPDTVLIPDIAFVAKERVPTGADADKIARFAPDLAVEVLSPSNRPARTAERVQLYLEGGTRLLWLVDADTQTVTVFRPGQVPRTLGIDDTLDGEDVIPGFQLPLAKVFA